MRLFELVGVKKHTKLTLTDLITTFEQLSGYEYIGGGNFAKVFKHPTKDEVIKFWVQDAAYEKYVNYCLQNQSNKHLPKIYSPIRSLSTFHRRMSEFPDKIKYVRMEMLSPVKAEDFEIDPDISIKTVLDQFFVQLFYRRYLDIKKYKDRKSWGPREKKLWDNIEQLWDGEMPDKVYDLYMTAENLPIPDSGLDVHYKNIMTRDNGDLVLVDPVADRDSIEKMDQLVHGPDAIKDDQLDKFGPEDGVVTGKAKKK